MFRFWYVYILMCKGEKSYVGCARDLKSRIKRHRLGYVPATKGLRPMELTAYFAFEDKYKAYRFEKYLKSGSGRAFLKRHLI
jgi:putative endonuclease